MMLGIVCTNLQADLTDDALTVYAHDMLACMLGE